MAKLNFETKVENGGTTAAGRLSASEINAIRDSINALYDALFENGVIPLVPAIKASVLPEAKLSPDQFEMLGDGYIGLIGFDNIGTGGGTGPIKLTTPTPTASVISTTQINLNCSAIPNADGYTWQRAINSNFSDATTISSGSSTSFNNTGLAQNTMYYFRVKATSTNLGYTESNFAATSAKTNAVGATTPDAPTLFIVDDVANTGNWTNNPTYTTLSDYEQTLDAGLTVEAVTTKPLSVGDLAKAPGQVGVRVKGDAGTNRNPSAWLFNETAYNSTGGETYIVEQTILINFRGEFAPDPTTPPPYFNVLAPTSSLITTANGYTSPELINSENVLTGITLINTGAFTGSGGQISTEQAAAGDTGVYPNPEVNTSWNISGGSSAKVKLNNTNPAKFYQIYILMPAGSVPSVRGATIGGVTKNKTAVSILGSFGTAGNGLNDPEWIVFNNITGSSIEAALNRVSGDYGSFLSLMAIEVTNIAK